MEQKYEYKFVRLGEGFIWIKSIAQKAYQDVINEHAKNGWRLVQIFSPSLSFYGVSRYFELIFEREKL
ncbi:DUF4177 domain-containing protein [Bacteroidota bacterium]